MIFWISIVIILLCVIFFENKEQFTHISRPFKNYPHTNCYKIPYKNHEYYEKCLNSDHCYNSRCVYKSLQECQNECKRGCQYCMGGTWRCELQ